MKTKIQAILLFTLSLVLSACATQSAEDVFAENQGLQQMTSERLQAVFDGNTLEWGDGSIVYYTGAEIRTPESDGTVTVGTISFTNNQHCRSWGGADKCSTVYENGDGKLSFFVGGKPDSSGGFGRIVTGNTKDL